MAHCAHTAPSRTDGSMAEATSAVASASNSIVSTTSAAATASTAPEATCAPSEASGSALPASRFHTTTSRPARSRLRAMPAPINPVPSTATVFATFQSSQRITLTGDKIAPPVG